MVEIQEVGLEQFSSSHFSKLFPRSLNPLQDKHSHFLQLLLLTLL